MIWQAACRGARWQACLEPSLMSHLQNASSLQTHIALIHQTASELMLPAGAVMRMLCGSLAAVQPAIALLTWRRSGSQL